MKNWMDLPCGCETGNHCYCNYEEPMETGAEYCENCFLWSTDKTNYKHCPDCGTELHR